MPSTTQKGIVRFYHQDRGFGYIYVHSTGEEIYVKANQLITPIHDKDIVCFTISENKQGLFAQSVSKI